MNKRTTNYILAVAMVAAVVLAYMTSFSGIFLLDDIPAIFRNPKVVGEKLVFSGHRWLVDMTFRMNIAFGGSSPFSFHLINLLIHLANALLVFGIVRRTMLRFELKGNCAVGADLFAWVTALIWAVHPLTTQGVTYICQRYESMTGLFSLAALYCFVVGMESAGRQRIWLNACLAVLILGMGTKESIAVVPLLIFAYDYVFSRKPFHDIVSQRGLFHVASFATMFILLLYQVQLAADQMSGVQAGSRLGSLGPLAYLYTQASVILYYIQLALWPYSLCFDYAWQAEPVSASGTMVLVFHVLLFLGSVLALIRKKSWGFALFAFYLLLAPTSSFVPVADLAVEHRMYMPLILVVVAVVSLLRVLVCRVRPADSSRRISPLTLFTAAAALISVALGAETSSRNIYYSSGISMWGDVCSKRPHNLRARNDLAVALSGEGLLEQALAEYYAVIDRVPRAVRESCDRGDSMVTGSFLKNTPEYAYFVACANLGTMYCNEARDYDLAFEWYLKALRIAPSNADVRRSAKNLLRAFGHKENELDQVLNDAINESIRERRK